jgi:hypothetical protein
MGKMGSPVAFVLDPVETKERKKEDSPNLPHKRFFCHTRIATPNRYTMANDSLPHLKQQWQ